MAFSLTNIKQYFEKEDKLPQLFNSFSALVKSYVWQNDTCGWLRTGVMESET